MNYYLAHVVRINFQDKIVATKTLITVITGDEYDELREYGRSFESDPFAYHLGPDTWIYRMGR